MYIFLIVFVIIFLIFVGIVFIIASFLNKEGDGFIFESPVKKAGRKGEETAYRYIKEVLSPDDIILRNVEIKYNEMVCECDNVIINRYGIFIIEVKNYNGKLSGYMEDYYWKKTKVTIAGNVYVKNVSNPLKQVDRQIYILSNYLRDNGIHIWINGYSFLLNNNVISERILHTPEEIDKAIHTRDPKNMRHISKPKQQQIINLLK